MDGYTTKLLIVGGVLVGLLFLWVIWKFFFGMLKHVVIILLLGGIFAGGYYFFRTPSSPAKNPAVGKHAYMTDSGKYLGVVEGEGKDPQRGAIWNVRFPGGHQVSYGKWRVTLKDKWEPEVKQQNQPAQSPKPNAENKPATKADKEKK